MSSSCFWFRVVMYATISSVRFNSHMFCLGVHVLFILFLRKLVSIMVSISDDVCVNSNTTGITSGAGTANPSGAPKFTPVL